MRKAVILAAGVWMAGALLAQPPRQSVAGQPWWDSTVVVSSLNLSEAQTKQVKSIQQASVGRLMDLRAAVNKAESNLEDVFNQSAVDELKAEAAVDQYANARDNMTRELTRLSLKMRGVLTAEQWQQLVDRQNGRGPRTGRGGGRRGGLPTTSSNRGSSGSAPAQK